MLIGAELDVAGLDDHRPPLVVGVLKVVVGERWAVVAGRGEVVMAQMVTACADAGTASAGKWYGLGSRLGPGAQR